MNRVWTLHKEESIDSLLIVINTDAHAERMAPNVSNLKSGVGSNLLKCGVGFPMPKLPKFTKCVLFSSLLFYYYLIIIS